MDRAVKFEKNTFGRRLKTMLAADTRRMLTKPLVYIVVGACLVMPILILVMTTMLDGSVTVDPQTGVETVVEGFDNVWQIIGSVSGESAGMSMIGMCNINLLYFFAAVVTCIFVGQDFRSGYAKNLFTVRAKKADCVLSKTLVCFLDAALMMLAFFAGSMLGGAMAGLPFDPGAATTGCIILCMLTKILLTAVFVAIAVLWSVVGRQKLWLSLVGSLCVGMLLFMMIPMLTPLDATQVNALIYLLGGGIFGVGLGAVSCRLLNRLSLV